MNTVTQTDASVYQCRYCEKQFRRESSLSVHVCEQKRRWQEEKEVGVQLGLQAYLRFYELTQGSARLKTFDDFARSPYYRAFVKFGRYCQSIRAVNVSRFIDWVIKQNKKIDHWCQDRLYTEYLVDYVLHENVDDAMKRSLETALTWEEITGHPAQDYLRHGNVNSICHDIMSGRVSPWVLYNTGAGEEFLTRLNQEQIAMIWPMIDTDAWQRRFRDYAADAAYVRELLSQAGW